MKKEKSKTISFKTPKNIFKLTKAQKDEIDRIKKWEEKSGKTNILIK